MTGRYIHPRTLAEATGDHAAIGEAVNDNAEPRAWPIRAALAVWNMSEATAAACCVLIAVIFTLAVGSLQ